uniref:Uncharacterized protein n=1 Tax=Anguilla anguilla TaxID=7936 RepID=A0A0E9PMT0_ANGAN
MQWGHSTVQTEVTFVCTDLPHHT